jgi:hypothetical protein
MFLAQILSKEYLLFLKSDFFPGLVSDVSLIYS